MRWPPRHGLALLKPVRRSGRSLRVPGSSRARVETVLVRVARARVGAPLGPRHRVHGDGSVRVLLTIARPRVCHRSVGMPSGRDRVASGRDGAASGRDRAARLGEPGRDGPIGVAPIGVAPSGRGWAAGDWPITVGKVRGAARSRSATFHGPCAARAQLAQRAPHLVVAEGRHHSRVAVIRLPFGKVVWGQGHLRTLERAVPGGPMRVWLEAWPRPLLGRRPASERESTHRR